MIPPKQNRIIILFRPIPNGCVRAGFVIETMEEWISDEKKRRRRRPNGKPQPRGIPALPHPPRPQNLTTENIIPSFSVLSVISVVKNPDS